MDSAEKRKVEEQYNQSSREVKRLKEEEEEEKVEEQDNQSSGEIMPSPTSDDLALKKKEKNKRRNERKKEFNRERAKQRRNILEQRYVYHDWEAEETVPPKQYRKDILMNSLHEEFKEMSLNTINKESIAQEIQQIFCKQGQKLFRHTKDEDIPYFNIKEIKPSTNDQYMQNNIQEIICGFDTYQANEDASQTIGDDEPKPTKQLTDTEMDAMVKEMLFSNGQASKSLNETLNDYITGDNKKMVIDFSTDLEVQTSRVLVSAYIDCSPVHHIFVKKSLGLRCKDDWKKCDSHQPKEVKKKKLVPDSSQSSPIQTDNPPPPPPPPSTPPMLNQHTMESPSPIGSSPVVYLDNGDSSKIPTRKAKRASESKFHKCIGLIATRKGNPRRLIDFAVARHGQFIQKDNLLLGWLDKESEEGKGNYFACDGQELVSGSGRTKCTSCSRLQIFISDQLSRDVRNKTQQPTLAKWEEAKKKYEFNKAKEPDQLLVMIEE